MLNQWYVLETYCSRKLVSSILHKRNQVQHYNYFSWIQKHHEKLHEAEILWNIWKKIQVAVARAYESSELGEFNDVTQIYFVIQTITNG